MKEHTRRIPTEGVFMNYRTDDLIYGFLQAIATYNPDTKELYLKEETFRKNRKVLVKLLNLRAGKTLSINTPNNKVKALLKEETLLNYDQEKKIYRFPYNPNEKYKLITADLLMELCNTFQPHAIKIFVYLLDKYEWKKRNNEQYVFTYSEIAAAMGYSSLSSIDVTIIGTTIEMLNKAGYISYEKYYEDVNGRPTPRNKLYFVTKEAIILPEIKQRIKEEHEELTRLIELQAIKDAQTKEENREKEKEEKREMYKKQLAENGQLDILQYYADKVIYKCGVLP